MSKILGTVVCVGGAMAMAFFKGPKLLNHSLGDLNLLLHSASRRWVMGALFLVANSSCWSLWLILQVPICKTYLDPLTLSAWMCLLSTLQSALLTSFLLPDMAAWRIRSLFDLLGCLFAGAFGSGVTFYLQSWCISVRGPVYSAMFNPLCTIITTAVAAIVLHEELHVGSLMGAACSHRRWPVHRAVGQSRRRQGWGGAAGARRRFGEDGGAAGFAARRRRHHRGAAPAGRRELGREVGVGNLG